MQVSTMAEQLFYLTLKINTSNANGEIGSGTGFIFSYKSTVNPESHYLFLVTNKHVIENTVLGSIVLHLSENNQPKVGETFTLHLDNPQWQNMWFGHPDANIDIAICPFVPLINSVEQSSGKRPFFTTVSNDMIPTEAVLNGLDAVENITFVGYPNGIWDSYHNLPIIRKGTTATPLQIDFENEPKFLIDASVFGGSSGSPVFIFNEGLYFNKQGSITVSQGGRFYFLGVIAAVYLKNNLTDVISIPIPTSVKSMVKYQEMIDLGIVFKSNTVRETVEAFFSSINQQP
ncbi:trypsin-like peptidase domain-containing protein [Acinetobacter sp.]|uniref:trypsin-like peptidase domain-containing protein n=1 Tax=Acinetobacter sp. TaxID=472 RepID=UPI002649392C|nr:trypsin-like peptidase domain-containing protein [Acinetobacter sp.]MDN5511535.1 serine protease [Acinetobacter sp.]MDN5524769.1 serine protease [Acinetobacter sp.]